VAWSQLLPRPEIRGSEVVQGVISKVDDVDLEDEQSILQGYNLRRESVVDCQDDKLSDRCLAREPSL
jgi:hypothetical protein